MIQKIALKILERASRSICVVSKMPVLLGNTGLNVKRFKFKEEL